MRLADVDADESSFAFRDLTDQDVWTTFAPVFGSLTVVGATSYSGRLRFVGRQCQFQVKFSAATSIASTKGTTYLTLPVMAQGLAGQASMGNDTLNESVGDCHVKVSEGKVYLPDQSASGNVFTIAGWCEV